MDSDFGGAPLVFPHYVGPGMRDLTPVLLYHGKLAVSLPGWPNNSTVATFSRVGEHAQRTAHQLAPVFNLAGHFFELAQEQALREIESLKPLGDRVSRSIVVYPGTSFEYEQWDESHDTYLPLVRAALGDPLFCCTASVEFVWRVWELSLELGADPDDESTTDPAKVLAALTVRAERLGSADLLMAECVLHRFFLPSSGIGSYATSSPIALVLLAAM